MQTGIGWCGSVDNRRRVRKIVSHQFLFLRLCKMSTRKGRNDSQRNGLCTDPLPCCVCLLPLPPHRSQAFLPPLWARDLTVRAGAITSADERGADPEAESRWSPALGCRHMCSVEGQRGCPGKINKRRRVTSLLKATQNNRFLAPVAKTFFFSKRDQILFLSHLCVFVPVGLIQWFRNI